uniref:Uncharacterized protein n=1 Tax=Anguilla anguilla TaxID=7936 RepID=A0A0E9RG92_ANGAN
MQLCSASLSGRGKNPEEGEEEDPEQAVCPGEQEEEEGVCGWPGEQVKE